MAFDLQEQEQIDWIKTFWAQWGKLLSAVVLAVLLSYLGYKGWQMYRAAESAKAATIYSQLEQQVQAGALDKVKATAAALQSAHPGSAYAANAALLAAKAAFDKGDLAFARAQLKWLLASGQQDESLQAVARLRLATVLLDEKQYDAALAELAQAHPASFDTLFLDLKGDVLVARGDVSGARDSYKAALAKASPDATLRDFIQTKLDSLGN